MHARVREVGNRLSCHDQGYNVISFDAGVINCIA